MAEASQWTSGRASAGLSQHWLNQRRPQLFSTTRTSKSTFEEQRRRHNSLNIALASAFAHASNSNYISAIIA